MKIVGKSDIGKVREENQDSFWFRKPEADGLGMAVVCDGMGGARGGQQASSIAVAAVRDYLESHSPPMDMESAFREIVSLGNRYVYQKSCEDPELSGMGTTMVLAVTDEKTAWFANVGDSRGYHITNGGIRQITKDHSAVQELVDSGHLTERQAKIHPNKNVITRAIGIDEEVYCDYFKISVSPGDVIILCTDGLSNSIDESEIQFEISGGSFEELPNRLIDLANSRGGADNITVVAIQI